ncbi:GNAT family N-acetyltransferase [Bacteroidia bacterium]|nr:GNAT family N-acetyltransferase [Bacteroidia bacterium]GHT62499.1 GNAT family N-acetyltransferase [Bacteroidia bacterium]
MIRNVKLSDAARIAEIYNYYIENTVVTFDAIPVAAENIRHKIEEIRAKGYPYLVCEKDEQLVGYAYLNTWRSRAAYNITLETSIYLDIQHTGKNLGTKLYAALIEKASGMNIHSLIGVISLPNDESRKLHEKFGFQLIGNFREAGIKFNKLIDVEFWQKFL